MAVYPESVKVEAFIVTWVDLSAYVVRDIIGSYGIRGTEVTDRVASTGTLKLSLNNTGGQFSPDGYYAMAGFQKGTPIRLSITYGEETVVKWFGHVRDIELDAGGWGERLAKVTVVDWFDYASTFPITLNSVLYNQYISEAVDTLVNALPEQPINTQYSLGTDIFPTVLDTGKSTTRATSEFQKLALSEWGFIYLRRDRWDGETLVVEARHDRRASSTATTIPVSIYSAGHLLAENSDRLVLESGEAFLLDEEQAITFSNKATEIDAPYGKNIRNYVVVKNYPRRVDTSPQVLYSLSSPITLGAGETKTVRVKYTDPAQAATKVGGVAMVTPVPFTDYEMSETSSGSGVDLTTNLSLSVTFGGNDAEIVLTNNGTKNGYVVKLNLRGLGVYSYEGLEFVEVDSSSIGSYGYEEETVDQKYQANDYNSRGLALHLLAGATTPRTILKEATFLANVSDELLQAFLFHDVGDLINVKETQTGVDGYYYIQGCDFTIKQGGIITFTFTVVEAITLYTLYWELDRVGFSELGTNTVLGY